MENFTLWMEKHFVPIAVKFGSQKHLVAIRDAFISILPITMAGAFATMLNAIVRDLPGKFELNGITEAFSWLIGINGFVWWGTLAMTALIFSFAIGYQITKAYDIDPLAGGLVSLASFLIVTPQVASFEATIAAGTANEIKEVVAGWGYIGVGYTDAKGLFTALIVGVVVAIIYSKLMQKKVTIKLPDEVPSGVSQAFATILPGIISLYAISLVAWLLSTYMGTSLADLIGQYVQAPFLALSQGLPAVIILTMMVSILWFFGIHGTNVLAPVLDGVYLTALRENAAAHEAGNAMKYFWTRGSFDAYGWMGGAGCTFALIIALLIFSKKQEEKTLAKLAAPMGVFNINEPVVFGLPIVLNPVYVIPWVLVPTLLIVIAYLASEAGIVPPVYVETPWVMPPVLYAWFATGFSWKAIVLAIVNLGIGTAIWSVFVLLSNSVNIEG